MTVHWFFTFAAFLLIDHFRSRRARCSVAGCSSKRRHHARLQPSLVGGFAVPSTCAITPDTLGIEREPNLIRSAWMILPRS